WGDVSCLAYSRDGRYLAASAGVQVRVWNTETREQVHQFRHAWVVDSLAFTADGTRLITVGPRLAWTKEMGEMGVQLKTWDLTSSQEALVLDDHTGGGGWAVAFSPDNRHLASSHGTGGKSLTIWDLKTRQPVLRLTNDAEVYGVAYNNDGSQLAAARQ